MKRSKKRFTTFYLAAAAVLSLMIGIGLPRIQAFSADIVSRLFPVVYQITYRDTQAQTMVAPVHFLSDTAIVATSSGDTVIPVSDAVFVCLENELHIQNTLRSGLLTALLVLAAACLPAVLASTAFVHSTRKVCSGVKRHAHAVPHRSAVPAHSPPTVSSAA